MFELPEFVTLAREINETVTGKIIRLHNRPGGYDRLMDSHAVGRPCPTCGAAIEKIQYSSASSVPLW